MPLYYLVTATRYLDGLIEATDKPGSEGRRRIGEAKIIFRNLKRGWRHADLSRYRKLEIYKVCIASKLLYNLSTLGLIDVRMNNIDAFHYRRLRSFANIPAI